jgi:hypothetical protein
MAITQLEAGTTVSKFLEQLNTNFSEMYNEYSYKITIADATENTTINRPGALITITDGKPSGGDNGDIVILYE